jgi:hypothetical protein
MEQYLMKITRALEGARVVRPDFGPLMVLDEEEADYRLVRTTNPEGERSGTRIAR